MTKDELKLAFQKAFQMGQDYWYYADHEFESYNKKSDAIRAKFNEMVKETIEEALAQPEQDGECKYCTDGCPACDARKLPPQRTWVGLTPKETFEIGERLGLSDIAWVDLMQAIEAKLKQKNT